MQQGGGSHSRYGGTTSSTPDTSSPPASAAPHHHGLIVEDASPISSRPPVPDDMEQLMPEIDAFVSAAAEDRERGGGRGGGGGNRWPRQETVSLLKIRSDMDATFRDASLKGPLWEDVSRKMGEVGYKRSAKKCKEKFENVHKYYKRTREGRVGRQDGKTYKFFSELEGLHTSTPSSSSHPLLHPPMTLPPAPPPTTSAVNLQASSPVSTGVQFANLGVPVPSMVAIPPTVSPIFQATVPTSSPLGLIFSSNSSSSSPGSDNYEDDVERQPSTAGSSRKRKRATETSSGLDGQRMEYLEGLMKRVMQRQEEMQKRFLEAVEKREQDRLAREETWRRQEIARLTREQELMAQERVVSASRDAVILSFLQKITGQMIQLPSMATVTAVPVVSPQPLPPSQVPVAAPSPSSTRQQHHQPQRKPPPPPLYQPPPQEITGTSRGGVGASGEMTSSSRWPKEEVLALISLRSGMELKYQEVGPKGLLWEEISAGMQRLGYKRNPKRCKEKWENINKYFKKVKESNKKRPEEAKTCPYFHELDVLYRKKVLGNQGSGIEIRLGVDVPANVSGEVAQRGVVISLDNLGRMKNTGPEGEETENTNKPEDAVKEMNHHLEQHQARVVDFEEKADGLDDDQENENEDDLEEDEDEEMEEERKMAYKIEYQQRRQNSRPPNGSESGSTPSFAAMIQ